MATTEERLTRLEDAVRYLAIMLTDGNPFRSASHLSSTVQSATNNFKEVWDAIGLERSSGS